jgi:hypothetical protein
VLTSVKQLSVRLSHSCSVPVLFIHASPKLGALEQSGEPRQRTFLSCLLTRDR